jgi:creatinine amidohydrolase
MNELSWGHYERLRPPQIEAIKTRSPIAYLPWGAIEWHSQHAPVGLDSCKAAGICAALAEKTGGLVFPAVYFGASTIKSLAGFPHTVEFSVELVTNAAWEFCEQLADEKFETVIILTGHTSEAHVVALKVGAERAAKRLPHCHFEVWPDSELIEGDFSSDHAGATETSFQLVFDRSTVDVSSQPSRALTLEADGVVGEHPSLSSLVRGQQQLRVAVERGVTRLSARSRKSEAR